MKSLFVLLLLANSLIARELPSSEVSRIANAIYRCENSKTYPYGIRIKGKHFTKEQAEAICKNTIRNNYQRWQSAGEKEDFITFLGNRYCPKECDSVGNKNWIRNMHKLML